MNKLSIALVIWGTASLSAQLATFDFVSNYEVTSQPASGDFSAIGGSPGITEGLAMYGSRSVLTSSGWSTGVSRDGNRYLSYTITPDPGYEVNVDSLRFWYNRNTSGPKLLDIGIYVDGSASASEYSTFSVLGPSSSTESTFDFTDISGASEVEFRFFGYNASSSAGILRMDTLRTFGSFTEVPEPSAYAVVGVVGMALLACFRLPNRKMT